MAAAAHPLVVAAFALSIVNLAHVCYQGCMLWSDASKDLLDRGTQRPQPKVDVSCWLPAGVGRSAEEYTMRTCSSRFKKVITGQMDLDSAGIGAPNWNKTDDQYGPGPFMQAVMVMSDMPIPGWKGPPRPGADDETDSDETDMEEIDTLADDMFVSDTAGNSAVDAGSLVGRGPPPSDGTGRGSQLNDEGYVHGPPPPSDDGSKRGQPPSDDENPYEWSKLLPLLYFEVALTILGFLLAVCYTRMARRHSCFLNVAWRRAASGEQVVGSSGFGGRSSLLERNPELVSERLQSLLNSRMMSVTYALVTLVMIIVWIVIGISMAGCISSLNGKISRVEDRALAMRPRPPPPGAPGRRGPPPSDGSGRGSQLADDGSGRGTPPSYADDAHNAHSGLGRGKRNVANTTVPGSGNTTAPGPFTYRGTLPGSMQPGQANDQAMDNTAGQQDNYNHASDSGFRPGRFDGPRPGRMRRRRPTYSAGDFYCYFEIAGSPVESHSVQCGYEVSRDPSPLSERQQTFSQMQDLLTWKFIIMQNMAGCFIYAFILILHIGFMYISEPTSTEKTIFPVMAMLGSRPKNLGLRFGLTDLFFVAAFSDLHDKMAYVVNTSGAQQEMLSATNSHSNLSHEAGPLPEKTNV